MATTYRYMALAAPTNLGLIGKQLAPSVGAISITTPPPTMLDITLTNTSASDKQDLDTYMTSIGYAYMATDPAPLTNGETVVWENGAWTCVHISGTSTASLPQEGTTKQSFLQKLQHDFTCGAASEKYFIMYDSVIEASSGAAKVEAQLILDGTQVLASYKGKPGGADHQVRFSGHIEGAAYGVGGHTLHIEYKLSGGRGTVMISDARVTTRRAF